MNGRAHSLRSGASSREGEGDWREDLERQLPEHTSLVFGAQGVDLWSPSSAAVLLVAVSALACLPPTRLAARPDILAVLRRP